MSKTRDTDNQSFNKFIYMKTRALAIILSGLLFQSCQDSKPADYRPEFHFSPEKNWVNDPNGLIYLDGEYHIFTQYNPYGDKWGHMSWGHAVSTDLVSWTDLPVALTEFPNPDGSSSMFFSGCAVVDSLNTSGFFREGYKGGLVAIYTIHIDRDGKGAGQSQGLAYSEDKGRTWKVYEGNPVLDIGIADFRDPSVIWYPERNVWIMTVALPKEYKVQFYESANLKDWALTGEFGNKGDVSKIWECPSLSQVKTEGTDETRWVLIISSGHKYERYVGMQYFVGDFDGRTFVSQDQEGVLHLDEGKDFYAAIPFYNLPPDSKSPIIMGWANNWAYANDIPTEGYRGQYSLARALTLYQEDGIFKIRQTPVLPESIPTEKVTLKDGEELTSSLSRQNDNVYRIQLTAELGSSKGFELELLKHGPHKTVISYDPAEQKLTFDRSNSGKTGFHENFPGGAHMTLAPENGIVKLDVIVDKSVIELYANDGKAVMTQLAFPLSGTTAYKINWR